MELYPLKSGIALMLFQIKSDGSQSFWKMVSEPKVIKLDSVTINLNEIQIYMP